MATRGWENVTPTDLARRAAKPTPVKAHLGRQKFHAEPCLVTPDGTLFTAAEILTAEVAAHDPLTGTLIERAERRGIRGQWFASTKEGRRYLELKLLERSGAISDLCCQVPYDLTVISEVDGSHHVVCRLVVDFRYRREGAVVVEDVKGARTLPIAKLKIKMLEAQYGIKVHEVRTIGT